MLKKFITAFIACSAALSLLTGCKAVDNSPVGKGVKTYERYSDELGKKRDVKFIGKDVIVEPEADKKIRFNF